MSDFIAWLKDNPTIVPLLTAFIGAGAALAGVYLTQRASSRRGNRELLSKKLEELYQLLNEAASDNVERYKILSSAYTDPEKYRLLELNVEKLYGLELNKKMVMYIRLYFPSLAKVHQKLFTTQRKLNELIYRIDEKDPPAWVEFDILFAQLGSCLRDMEEEMIKNRGLLTGERSLMRYKRAT